MQMETDTGKIKRKLYLSYFQDGLWDIFLGLFLLGWGFTVWFDLPWLPAIIFIAFFWLVLGLKQKITYPRTGYARPAEYRTRALRIAVAGIVLLLAIAVVIATVYGGESQFLHDYFGLLFNSAIAVVLAAIGYLLKVNRWLVYAALVFVVAVFHQWLGLSFQMSFIIPGTAILLCGLLILVNFLRRYSVISGEYTDAER